MWTTTELAIMISKKFKIIFERLDIIENLLKEKNEK
jgi:hypothetical protein